MLSVNVWLKYKFLVLGISETNEENINTEIILRNLTAVISFKQKCTEGQGPFFNQKFYLWKINVTKYIMRKLSCKSVTQ